MNRRVVLVIGQLQQGGAEGQLVALAKGLAGSSYDPAVACLSEVFEPHGTALREAGIPVEILPRHGHRDLSRARALAEYLKKREAGIVHSWLVGANAYAYLAARLAGIPRLVVSSRTSMPAPGGVSWMIHSWVFRSAAAVIANAEAVRAFTAAHYRTPEERIHVVRNGVDLESYRAASGSRGKARREMGAADGDVVVGTLGRLSREKNLELFVDLAAGLTRENPRTRFAIVGEGPHRPRIERAVEEAGLDGVVRFLGARADVPRILAGLDLFVMTSDTEGLPNAIMEAMAAGLPVVATRVGGTHEIVVDGTTGRLVPRGLLVPLLEAVRPLVKDAALRSRMGMAGRERIRSEFSVENMIAGTRAVYERILGSPGRVAS